MSCSNNQDNKTLILGLWKGSYEGQEISIEFLDSSTLIIDYGDLGKRLEKEYSIENDTLIINKTKRSVIEVLNKDTLKIRPPTNELKADIDLIHAVNFERSTE